MPQVCLAPVQMVAQSGERSCLPAAACRLQAGKDRLWHLRNALDALMLARLGPHWTPFHPRVLGASPERSSHP